MFTTHSRITRATRIATCLLAGLAMATFVSPPVAQAQLFGGGGGWQGGGGGNGWQGGGGGLFGGGGGETNDAGRLLNGIGEMINGFTPHDHDYPYRSHPRRARPGDIVSGIGDIVGSIPVDSNDGWVDDDGGPDVIYVPSDSGGYTEPRDEPPPRKKAKRNRSPEKKSEPGKNRPFEPLSLTQPQIDAAKKGTDEKTKQGAEALGESLKDNLPPDELDLLDTLNAIQPPIDEAKKNAILQAVKDNDPIATRQALTAAGIPEPHATDLVHRVDIQSKLDVVKEEAEKGTLSVSDLKALDDALLRAKAKGAAGVTEQVVQQAGDQFTQLNDLIEIKKALETAVPSPGGTLPPGTVDIIENPDLPEGSLIDLGNGTFIAGTGGEGAMTMTQGSAAEAAGLPVVSAAAALDYDKEPVHAGVLVANPADNSAEVNYLINGRHEYSMQPGMRHAMGEGRWTIEFDRGGDAGTAKYTLSDGTYHFVAGDDGWELVRQDFEVTIDNGENRQDFHYVVKNENAVVKAGQTKRHTSLYPIVVRYDRGAGDEAKKLLEVDGTYLVGVNARDNLWDIFAPGEAEDKGSSLADNLFQ